MKLLDLVGEPSRLPSVNCRKPTNGDVLRHFSFVRRQNRLLPVSNLYSIVATDLIDHYAEHSLPTILHRGIVRYAIRASLTFIK